MLWDGVLILIGILTGIVIWLRWNYNHWKNRGIPQVKPTIIFGNIKDGLIGGTSMAIVSQRMYNAYPGEPVVGFYQLRRPVLQIRDLDLIKAVLVTQFQNFHDGGRYISKEVDPIWGRNPFFLKGDEWKETRRIQTQQHTASKLRPLFVHVEGVKDELIQCINKNENRKFEVQDLCKRFTTDIVSSCVFGVKTRSLAGEDSEFKKYSQQLLEFNWRFALWVAAPSLINILKIALVPKVCYDYFFNLVKETVEERIKNNVTRADFLQNFLSEKSKNFTLIDVTAQMMIFSTDGYATTASVMSFMIYMLAIHPDVQERLRDEINSNEKLDFENIQQLPYLDAVVHETLRLYPAGAFLYRQCNENTTITVNERKVEFKVGDELEIPIYAIQRDPAHFPDPLKFYPDRFLDNPNQPAFLAFGNGPRACAGTRFAKTVVKAGAGSLVKSFRVLPGTDDRSLPTIEKSINILLTPDKEMSVRFVKL